MSRASSAHGSASSPRCDVAAGWNNQPLLIVSLCGSSSTIANVDFVVVVRFAVPAKGLHASENQALRREAELLAPRLCKDLREIGLEAPERCGEISLDGMFLLQGVLSRCGAQWRPKLQLCSSVAEEKASWEERAHVARTVVARKTILQERTRTALPDLQKDSPRPRSPRESPRPGSHSSKPQTPRQKSTERHTEYLQEKLRSMGKSLVKLYAHLLELAKLVCQDQRCLEEHKYVLQHQFVTLLETTMERELALTQLEEESHRWAYQNELGMIGQVLKGVDSDWSEVAEDAVAAHLLNHFDRHELSLVEQALASNTNDGGVLLAPHKYQTPSPQQTNQIMATIMSELRSMLASECAVPEHELSQLEAAVNASEVGVENQGSSEESDGSEPPAGFSLISMARAVKKGKNKGTAKNILVLVRRMIWDSSLGMQEEPSFDDSTHSKIHNIRLNMSSALMSQALASFHKKGQGKGKTQDSARIPHGKPVNGAPKKKRRAPEVSPEQDSPRAVEDTLSDALIDTQEAPCELFTIHSDSDDESGSESCGSDSEDAELTLRPPGMGSQSLACTEQMLQREMGSQSLACTEQLLQREIGIACAERDCNINESLDHFPRTPSKPADWVAELENEHLRMDIEGEKHSRPRAPTIPQARTAKKRPFPIHRGERGREAPAARLVMPDLMRSASSS